jgi:uncharacterized DUF497 family protein
MRFEWDENKAAKNLKKHGIGFADAIEVFDDFNAVDSPDESHSENEIRFNIIGLCGKNLIFVVFTEVGFDAIRLISARRTTKFEEKIYVNK